MSTIKKASLKAKAKAVHEAEKKFVESTKIQLAEKSKVLDATKKSLEITQKDLTATRASLVTLRGELEIKSKELATSQSSLVDKTKALDTTKKTLEICQKDEIEKTKSLAAVRLELDIKTKALELANKDLAQKSLALEAVTIESDSRKMHLENMRIEYEHQLAILEDKFVKMSAEFVACAKHINLLTKDGKMTTVEILNYLIPGYSISSAHQSMLNKDLRAYFTNINAMSAYSEDDKAVRQLTFMSSSGEITTISDPITYYNINFVAEILVFVRKWISEKQIPLESRFTLVNCD
jgi:predicted HicB family RNase H-like nuclease